MKFLITITLLAVTINLYPQETSFNSTDQVGQIDNVVSLTRIQKVQALSILSDYVTQLDSLSNVVYASDREKNKEKMLLLHEAKKKVYAILTPEQYQLYKAYRVSRRDSFIQSRSNK